MVSVQNSEIGNSISENCNFMQFPQHDSFWQNVFNRSSLRCFHKQSAFGKGAETLVDRYVLSQNFHFLLHFMILIKVQLWITKLALGECCSMNQFPLSLPCIFVITFTFLLHFHFKFLSSVSLSTNQFPLSLAMHFQTTFPFFLKHNT